MIVRKFNTSLLCALFTTALLWAFACCGDDTDSSEAPDGANATADAETVEPEAALPPPPPPPPEEERIAYGMAKVAEAIIYESANSGSRKIGILRWGAHFEVSDTQGSGDDGWVKMRSVGWLKSTDVLTRRRGQPKMGFVPVAPKLGDPLPFRYARVIAEEVPVYRRPPRRGEDPQRAFLRNFREGYFFTLDKFVNIYDRRMYRTTGYWFVPREGTTVVSGPLFHGVEVDEETTIPFLWVTDPTAVLCDSPREADPDAGLDCPPIERHERLPYFERRDEHGIWYRTKGDRWIPALTVSKVHRIEKRPRGVGADERWVHVDLSNQFAALYEGDRMTYVTLISSGDDGHETPTGTFRVESKHISATMDNEDNPSGPYMIQDVPWVAFFRGAYALHGAFWHDRFGLPTSHGCVNLAPTDARRFFNFITAPELPEGWHAVYTPPHVRGTVVHITE